LYFLLPGSWTASPRGTGKKWFSSWISPGGCAHAWARKGRARRPLGTPAASPAAHRRPGRSCLCGNMAPSRVGARERVLAPSRLMRLRLLAQARRRRRCRRRGELVRCRAPPLAQRQSVGEQAATPPRLCSTSSRTRRWAPTRPTASPATAQSTPTTSQVSLGDVAEGGAGCTVHIVCHSLRSVRLPD